jgi:hypothetical protein
MKPKKSIAKSLSKKELEQILEERRRKKRVANARWRKKHPDVNKAIYTRYCKEKRDSGYVYKRGVGWVKKSEGDKQ